MTPYEARGAGDCRVAASCTEIPGGVRLSTPALPFVRDYNGVVLAPGAAFEVPDDVQRVNAFDLPGEVPDGWEGQRLPVLGFDGPAPAMPAEVAEVDGAALAPARAEMWRSFGVEEPALAQMLHMQALQAAAGRLFAVMDAGRPLGWAQVIEGFVDDVFVEVTARRQGLGRALSRAAMAAGGRFLTVEPDNEPAVALYRSLGFEDAGTLSHLTRG